MMTRQILKALTLSHHALIDGKIILNPNLSEVSNTEPASERYRKRTTRGERFCRLATFTCV